MALVEAHAAGDLHAVEEARQGLAPVKTIDILHSLFRFGQILDRANLSAEQTAIVEEELKITADSPEMAVAVATVGRALLIERSQPALAMAVNTYGVPLLNSTSDRVRQMTLILAAVTGAVCRRLKVSFNWR
ncbi:MAG TPA: hypothetical protein VMA95_20125 [Streptosporangiaceae bacterium]|nr:hypothetical protein [Streptosporangiaceae bacterium]